MNGGGIQLEASSLEFFRESLVGAIPLQRVSELTDPVEAIDGGRAAVPEDLLVWLERGHVACLEEELVLEPTEAPLEGGVAVRARARERRWRWLGCRSGSHSSLSQWQWSPGGT